MHHKILLDSNRAVQCKSGAHTVQILPPCGICVRSVLQQLSSWPSEEHLCTCQYGFANYEDNHRPFQLEFSHVLNVGALMFIHPMEYSIAKRGPCKCCYRLMLNEMHVACDPCGGAICQSFRRSDRQHAVYFRRCGRCSFPLAVAISFLSVAFDMSSLVLCSNSATLVFPCLCFFAAANHLEGWR